jgi:hypothetical protein
MVAVVRMAMDFRAMMPMGDRLAIDANFAVATAANMTHAHFSCDCLAIYNNSAAKARRLSLV